MKYSLAIIALLGLVAWSLPINQLKLQLSFSMPPKLKLTHLLKLMRVILMTRQKLNLLLKMRRSQQARRPAKNLLLRPRKPARKDLRKQLPQSSHLLQRDLQTIQDKYLSNNALLLPRSLQLKLILRLQKPLMLKKEIKITRVLLITP